MRLNLLLSLGTVLLLASSVAARARSNQYIEYKPGDLNLVISVPHGGTQMPDGIRNRTAGCYLEDTKTCLYRHNCTQSASLCGVTIEPDDHLYNAGQKVRTFVYELTGKYPYLVVNLLNRLKLDANRDVEEAAFGEPDAVAAWDTYHGSIEAAAAEIRNTHGYKYALLIDLHGQSHSHGLTELGYNLTATELDSGSYSLDTSTIRVAARLAGGDQNKSLIIGNDSLGYILEKQSIKCLPSPSNPTINGRSYFNGGYTSQSHSSDTADAIMVELARPVRSGNDTEFDSNMRKVATGFVEFLQHHYPVKSASSKLHHLGFLSLLTLALTYLSKA